MIFLDTSGLVALFDARDQHHQAGRAAWTRLQAEAAALVMTDLIVVETVTLLRRHAGFAAAQRVGERLLSGAVAELVYTDPDLMERGWALFEKYSDHDLSLTDAVSFALMRKRRMKRAFTFDKDFQNAGFDPVT
jgi:predicted nucleic acid-binding protein